ncbi:MAG: hypothetical protein HW388_1512 [Dehalococcoidia bacterium]|nr:hypothetical protein [Dehalococcoidia bacterium]
MRIGIKVADDILKRMEPFRHLTNVSQICRDAIEAWVDSYERARNRAREDGMEAVAARLQSEHAEQTVDWEALGHEDAKLWVQMATLEDFETLFHNLKVKERQGRSSENWIPHRHMNSTMNSARKQTPSKWPRLSTIAPGYST